MSQLTGWRAVSECGHTCGHGNRSCTGARQHIQSALMSQPLVQPSISNAVAGGRDTHHQCQVILVLLGELRRLATVHKLAAGGHFAVAVKASKASLIGVVETAAADLKTISQLLQFVVKRCITSRVGGCVVLRLAVRTMILCRHRKSRYHRRDGKP